MARYREGHREKTHAAIVAAASGIMRDRGFTEASVANVMKSVGLTHGGFYAHFPDKTGMLVEATQAAFVESPKNFSFLAALAAREGDVGLIARHYLAETRVADVASGCPAAALVSEMHRQERPVQSAFATGAEETVAAIAQAPGFAIEEGDQAWAALALLVGTLSLMRAMPDSGHLDTLRNAAIAGIRKLAVAG